jgi:hypothetical protein
MLFANSSPYTKQGQFYKLYEQAMQLTEDENGEPTGDPVYPDHFMMQFPSWALYEDWEEYGCPMPPAMRPEDDPITRDEEKADPDAFRVEVRAQFAEVINAFLRPEMVDRMYNVPWNEKILGYAPTPTSGAVAYMRYKGHGDPASTGPANFGVAVGHVEDVTNPDTQIVEQHVVFDLIDAFYPEDFTDPDYPDQPPTINWDTILDEIVTMINAFRPFEWTFDQFDTTKPVQDLRKEMNKLGVSTQIYVKQLNNEQNYLRAKTFRTALNLGRVHAPHPSTYRYGATKNAIELSQNELKSLQETKTAHGKPKVDKQNIGPVKTKDIADCMMEVVNALIGESLGAEIAELQESRIEAGALGGYAIGKGNTNEHPELAGWFSSRPGSTHAGAAVPGRPVHMPGRSTNRQSREWRKW